MKVAGSHMKADPEFCLRGLVRFGSGFFSPCASVASSVGAAAAPLSLAICRRQGAESPHKQWTGRVRQKYKNNIEL